MRSCQNNPENCYTEKKVKHKPSGYAWCSICSFDETKNRRYFYSGKDCVKKFCKDLRELGKEYNITESYIQKRFCYNKNKKKSEIIVITLENLEELLLANPI